MSDRHTPSKQKLIEEIIRGVCELPDYNSPDDQPELLQCTVQELDAILDRCLPDETTTELRAGDEVEYIDDGDTGVIVGPDPEGRAVVRWKSGVTSNPMLSKLRRAPKTPADPAPYTIDKGEPLC